MQIGAMVGDSAVFRPVRRGNAFEETVERLLQAIDLGVVADGQRLPPERELASRLRVSRVTLREAIRALQDAGWLVSRPGRHGGSFVAGGPAGADRSPAERPPPEAVADAIAFRAVVEPGAAALAASAVLDGESRRRLRSLQEACAGAGPSSYRQADSRLHLALAEAAGSPSLLAAVADVRSRVNQLLDAIPLLPANLTHADHQHGAVIAAVLAGDAERAHRAMLDHVEGTAALLRGFLVHEALDTDPVAAYGP